MLWERIPTWNDKEKESSLNVDNVDVVDLGLKCDKTLVWKTLL